MVEATKEAKAEAADERAIAPDNQTRIEATNTILKAIKDVHDDVRTLSVRIDEHEDEIRDLRRIIHGKSDPPPKDPDDGGKPRSPSIADMAKQGSIASGDVAELKGELLAVRAELKKQSNSMGIGKRGLDWLFSAQSVKFVVRLATLAGAIYAAFNAHR